ncbi:unnamed protein product [Soboliphyme baturini]|uniref:WD_REPEATS_REGION domain-containing protein n=1 Tax=Soboliphyme baturini TaxID=241478 RepID=A0A183J464_9BILA|nr:unnamed protein product [Soboliphyme baturini]
MQLIKPFWVHHEGHSIYSIDFQPSENRFVTGGQGGNGSGLVILWNLKPLIDSKAENDNAVPKLLCRLDSHVACVNCVRWCGTGKYLASAGDDKTIMIWHFAGRTAGLKSFSGGDSSLFPNAELWKCSSVLNGHSGDVLHLAWSTGDTYLASCSVDNSVIVWNALRFPEKVVVLQGHQGLVKGVCWDPLGKYLASQVLWHRYLYFRLQLIVGRRQNGAYLGNVQLVPDQNHLQAV